MKNDFLINGAINMAFAKKGPVHINAPFEEPLYETVSELTVEPKVISATAKEFIYDEPISEYANIWNTSKKKLVLVGVNEPNAVEQKFLDKLANDPSVVMMIETTSNLHHPKFINTIDSIVTPFTHEDFLDFQPEILVTFGGNDCL